MKKDILFLLLLIAGIQLNAQEFRTEESISKQLKNNTQPGMKYGPAVQPAANPSKGFTGSSLAKEIREGKYSRVQQGSAAAPATNRARNTGTANAATLPSNKSAEEVAREIKASQSKMPVPPPMQEEKNGTPVLEKTTPVKKAGQ
ncbi:MAG: hypothetical protein ACTHMV_11985 [Chitinophagaceae bacterium]